MFKKLKNYEMSKRIIYVLAYLIFALLPIVLIVSLVTGDTSALSQYVIGVFGLATVAVGFYYWKAKNENLHKYMSTDGIAYFNQRVQEELDKLKGGE